MQWLTDWLAAALLGVVVGLVAVDAGPGRPGLLRAGLQPQTLQGPCQDRVHLLAGAGARGLP